MKEIEQAIDDYSDTLKAHRKAMSKEVASKLEVTKTRNDMIKAREALKYLEREISI